MSRVDFLFEVRTLKKKKKWGLEPEWKYLRKFLMTAINLNSKLQEISLCHMRCSLWSWRVGLIFPWLKTLKFILQRKASQYLLPRIRYLIHTEDKNQIQAYPWHKVDYKRKRDRTEIPLSPPQIHQKNIWTLRKFHETTHEHLQRTPGTQKGSPLSSKEGRTKYKK